MDTGLMGKNVLVPGASSGIGLAIAQALGAEGANVILAARREDLVQAEASRLPSAVGIAVDLNEEGTPAALVEATEQAFGPIDVLVLNSGGPAPGGAADITDEQALAAEVAPDGVTVNMALPGRIDTERVASLDSAAAQRTGVTPAEARATSEAGIPARRYGTPAEFAAVVTFLASAPASYVTGEQIRCDGGLVRSY